MKLSKLGASLILFAWSQLGVAAANKACALLSDLRSGKISAAESKIAGGQNPFEVCTRSSISPAHFGVMKFPGSALSQSIVAYYLKHNEVDPNVMGKVDTDDTSLPNAVEENLTLFQASILSGDLSLLAEFQKKKGFDPNHPGKVVTAQGQSAESPLAIGYLLIFNSESKVVARLKRDEVLLRKVGSTFSNCEVLADVVDPDPAGSNLRAGPGGSFPIVGKVVKTPQAKNPPAVIISGYNMAGWFQVRHVFPAGYQNFLDQDLNSCAPRDDIKGEAWIHGSLIDFRQLRDQRAKNDRVVRSLCYGEASIQILGNEKILMFRTDGLMDKLPSFTASCER